MTELTEREAFMLQQINDNRRASCRPPMNEEEFLSRLVVAKETQEWTKRCIEGTEP